MAEQRKKSERKSKEQRQAQTEKQQQGKKLGDSPGNQSPNTPEKKESEEE